MAGKSAKKTGIIFLFCLFLNVLIISSSIFPQDYLNSAVPPGYRDGLQSRILQSVAEELGLKMIISEAPIARRLHYLENGSIDIASELLKTPDRCNYIHFISTPYKLKSNKIFIVRKGNHSLIRKYEDLYKFTIGTTIKSSYFNKFDSDTQIKKESVSSFKQNILKLVSGRIDAVIYSETFAFIKIK